MLSTLSPLRPFRRPHFVASGASSLLTGLVSYWTMDEASGTRADSVGSNALSSNNGVGSATGKIGDAATFNGSNQWLQAAFSGFPSGASAWEINGWLKPVNATGTYAIVCRWGAGGLSWEMYQLAAALNVQFNSGAITVTKSSALAAGTYINVSFGYDGANAFLIVNNGSADTSALASVTSSTEPFSIGREASGFYWPGAADAFGVWSRTLSSGERTSLYNSGGGLGYPF